MRDPMDFRRGVILYWIPAFAGMTRQTMNILKRIQIFIQESYQEMNKVNWPTKGETTKYTLIVIGVSLVVAVFLGGCDFVFTWLLNKFVISR